MGFFRILAMLFNTFFGFFQLLIFDDTLYCYAIWKFNIVSFFNKH